MTTPPQRAMTPGEPVAARISHGDLLPGLFAAYSRERRVAWDIETTGLDWQRDALGTCQPSGTPILRAAATGVRSIDSRAHRSTEGSTSAGIEAATGHILSQETVNAERERIAT